ncbi:MAG: PLP-dependent cysteine synthase family protein [Tannerellaceae bacterium]|jgi:cysteine synthase A|nr:PLP-dependent cysteine synthase family protein [Tannerellaceae bacterium]
MKELHKIQISEENMPKGCAERLQGLTPIIGNTPLLQIAYRFRNKPRRLFAKAEYHNLTGSIKDRMAYHILAEAYRTGELQPGMHIMEATSGNTGIAFSALGRGMGHEVTIFMPDWMSAERMNLIKSYGANVRLVSHEEGGFLGSIAMTVNEKNEHPDRIFLPRQFDNDKNCEAHFLTTAPEIVAQLKSVGLSPDAFVAGVGTGGTIMGVGAYLREMNANVSVFPLEPANSPTMSTGHKVGKHRMQGISDEFIPSIVRLDELDEIIAVDDGDAIIMAQNLASRLGLGVGITSGGNFLGAVIAQNRLGDEAVAVTVFADDNKKYLTTDYAKEEPMKDGFLSADIVLENVTVIRL